MDIPIKLMVFSIAIDSIFICIDAYFVLVKILSQFNCFEEVYND